jgi:predicted GTPase
MLQVTGRPVTSYQELRAETLKLFPALIEAAQRPGRRAAEERLTATREQISDDRLRVLVCGEFKRGKSSVLNGLLGEVKLLPEHTSHATSVVTTVVYGKPEQVTVYLADGTEQDISRGELHRYVTERGNPHNVKQVREVVIQVPNERLQAGLILVDTPGIGGAYPGHFRVTDALLPEADAIVFVTDTTAAVSPAEQQFLRRAAETAGVIDDEDALFFVMSKIDRERDYPTLQSAAQATLAKALGRPLEHVRVVPVSSLEMRKALETASTVKREHSNFDELEDMLWPALARRQAKILRRGALVDLRESVQSLRKPIIDAIDALSSPSAADEIRNTIDARYATRTAQAAANAQWQNDLSERVHRLVQDIQQRVFDEASEACQRLESQLGELLADLETLRDRSGSCVEAIVGAADWRLRTGIDQLQRELAQRYDLPFGDAEFAGLSAPPVPELRFRPARRPPKQPSLNTVSGVLSLSSVVGTIAAKLALAVFLQDHQKADLIGEQVSGAVVSVASGSVMLYRRLRVIAAQQRDQKEREGATRDELRQYFDAVVQHLAPIIADVARLSASRLRTDLESRIRQDLDSAEESARRVRDPGPLDAVSKASLLKELTAELVPLDRAMDRIAQLDRIAADLAGTQDHE